MYLHGDLIIHFYQPTQTISRSHVFRVAVIDWQAFEFEPIRIVITTSTKFTDNCPCAGCSILGLFCVAYTLLTRPNQVERAAQSLHFWLSVWTLSCRCLIPT